jgi:hypothetical protein
VHGERLDVPGARVTIVRRATVRLAEMTLLGNEPDIIKSQDRQP